MTVISRRAFLKIVTQSLFALSGLLGLGGLIRFLSYKPPPPPPQRFEIGSQSNYALNSRTVLPQVPALLIRTPTGFSAVSLVCSHLSCTFEVKSGGLTCPCHGSRYDLAGGVTHGPATQALRSLRVEVTTAGNLVIYKD